MAEERHDPDLVPAGTDLGAPLIPAGPEGDAARAELARLRQQRAAAADRRAEAEANVAAGRPARLTELMELLPEEGTPEFVEMQRLARDYTRQYGLVPSRCGPGTAAEHLKYDVMAVETVAAALAGRAPRHSKVTPPSFVNEDAGPYDDRDQT